MSFETERWQTIKKKYKISRRPHGKNSESTNALAVALPPTTFTLEMLRNVVSNESHSASDSRKVYRS
jgi:hypothetical protein